MMGEYLQGVFVAIGEKIDNRKSADTVGHAQAVAGLNGSVIDVSVSVGGVEHHNQCLRLPLLPASSEDISIRLGF